MSGSIGNYHVGTSKALSLTNTAAAGIYSEDLAANLTAGTNTSVSGSISNLVAGSTDNSTLQVTLGGAGAQAGSATLNLTSTGTVNSETISGLGTTPLTAQHSSVSGTGYNLARRPIRSVAASGTIMSERPRRSSLTNTAAAGSFSEDLAANLTAGTNTSVSGSIGNLLAGSTDNSTLQVTLGGAGAQTGTATLNLTKHRDRDSRTISGSGTTPLTAKTQR